MRGAHFILFHFKGFSAGFGFTAFAKKINKYIYNQISVVF